MSNYKYLLVASLSLGLFAQKNVPVLDANKDLVINTTLPGGAPAGSVAISGKYYGDGSQLTGLAGGGDMTVAAYITSGSGAPSNPCAIAGAQYRNTSASPVTFYSCPTGGGNWIGPFQTAISLTTTGSSGAATFSSGVLNIPQYSGGGGTITGSGTTGKIVKWSAATVLTDAASGDITALWTGSCSSSTFLRGDGACTTPGGGGTVTSSGSPLIHQLALFTTGTDIKGLAVGATDTVLMGTSAADPSFVAVANCSNDGSHALVYSTSTHAFACAAIAGGAGGTVTVVSSGSLTSTALVTGGGSQALQTPAATATMDASGNISTPGTVTAASFITGSGSVMDGTTDGYFKMTNNAGTAFTALRFGGTSASFPMWKRNSAGFDARLADDSAAAAITALTFNGLTVTNNGTNTLTITAGKTVTVSNTLTFTGTDSSSVAFGAGGTVMYTVTNVAVGQTPLTTQGDLWVGGSSGAPARLAGGALDTILQGGGASATPSYVGLVNCGDSSHGLAYSTSTHTWSCQSITGSGGGVADPGGNGIMARTALNTTTNRTITGTANQITVTNGDGVSGNPTLSIPSAPTFTNPLVNIESSLGTSTGAGLYIPGTSLTAGSAYYMASGGLTVAKADVSTTVPAVCLAISTTQCSTSGAYRFGSSQSWTAGAIIYISASSAGALVTTAPSTSGQFVQRFGIALAADTILILPSIDVGGVQ